MYIYTCTYDLLCVCVHCFVLFVCESWHPWMFNVFRFYFHYSHLNTVISNIDECIFRLVRQNISSYTWDHRHIHMRHVYTV